MFSALKKLTRTGDDRCPPPMPMSTSLQKKFSRGVHFNMKILIKGDRNVGKSCLLQRLQGGAFTEDYVPTDQIQVAPIHWTYKNTDFIIKVEVWEVVDKGRTKKKSPVGLKLENQSAPTGTEEEYETPVLDATFLDVYKNASGVILMMDITKPWTFEYVVKELSRIPADLPVVLLGNHCDMQHHRQVHPHHIEQAMHHAKLTRSGPIRYAESSMRNGFGLRLLHKFLSVPFLRLQKTSLLEQLQRNQKDMEEIERELDEFQNSDEAHYNVFLDRLTNKRRQSTETDKKINNDHSPSIVLGAGKPIIPPNVNPLVGHSLNPTIPKVQSNDNVKTKQSQFVSPDLFKNKPPVSMDMTPSKLAHDSIPGTPSKGTNVSMSGSSGVLDEFYAGTLDSSFLDDLAPINNVNQEIQYDTDSDDDNEMNPNVIVDNDDLDIEGTPPTKEMMRMELDTRESKDDDSLTNIFINNAVQHEEENSESFSISTQNIHHGDFPSWAGDASVRRSPEGGEDPDLNKEQDVKIEKKYKKKKSKDKDKGDYSDKSDRKEKKHKHKKSKSDKPNPQQDLLAPSVPADFNYEEYDSIS